MTRQEIEKWLDDIGFTCDNDTCLCSQLCEKGILGGPCILNVYDVLHDYFNQSKWIPVTMQLPEEPTGNFNDAEEIENAILQGQLTEYIVTIANATESTALYYAGDGYWWDDESKDFYNVAAWQPLPEPYKAT